MGKMHTLGLSNGLGDILDAVEFPKNHACTLSEERPECKCKNAFLLNRPQLMALPIARPWEAGCEQVKLADTFSANQKWSFCICCDIKPISGVYKCHVSSKRFRNARAYL